MTNFQPSYRAMPKMGVKVEVICGIAIVVLSFVNPFLAAIGTVLYMATQIGSPINLLLVYIICYPFTFLKYFSYNGVRIDSIIVFILAIISILINSLEKRRASESLLVGPNRRIMINAALMVWFSTAVLGSLLMANEDLSLWRMSLGSVIAFIIPALIIKDKSQFAAVVSVLKISAFILAVSAILSSFHLITFEYFKPKYSYDSPFPNVLASTGLMDSRGSFGVYMAFVLPFIYYSLSTIRKTKKPFGKAFLLNIILLSTVLAAIVLSVSRSTWLMVVVETALYFWLFLESRKSFRKKMPFLIPLTLLLVVAFYGLAKKTFNAVYMIRSVSVTERIEKDVSAFDSIIDHPMFGISHAQMVNKGVENLEVHNMFLDIAAENGLVSAVPVVLLFLLTFKMLLAEIKGQFAETRDTSICLMVAFVGMLVNLQFYAGWDKHIWLFLGLMNVFCLVAHSERRKKARGVNTHTFAPGHPRWA